MHCGEARAWSSASCVCARCLRSKTLTPSPSAVIKKYTRNTRFCLICNYVSKIIPALQSRCTRFRFPPLPGDYVRERLQFVIEHEQCGPLCLAAVGTCVCMCLLVHPQGELHRFLVSLAVTANGFICH